MRNSKYTTHPRDCESFETTADVKRSCGGGSPGQGKKVQQRVHEAKEIGNETEMMKGPLNASSLLTSPGPLREKQKRKESTWGSADPFQKIATLRSLGYFVPLRGMAPSAVACFFLTSRYLRRTMVAHYI